MLYIVCSVNESYRNVLPLGHDITIDNSLHSLVVCSSGMFPIITFEEFISIALDATRVVGIYPEIKNPILINQHVRNFSLYISLIDKNYMIAFKIN